MLIASEEWGEVQVGGDGMTEYGLVLSGGGAMNLEIGVEGAQELGTGYRCCRHFGRCLKRCHDPAG